MKTPAVRVQEKGQVTIPVKYRKKLGLKKGDFVTFIETEAGLVIKPAEMIVIASEALDEVGKALEAKGISLEELIESGREIKQEIYEEKYARDSDDQ